MDDSAVSCQARSNGFVIPTSCEQRGGAEGEALESQDARRERIKMYCLEGVDSTDRQQQFGGSTSSTTMTQSFSSSTYSEANDPKDESETIPTTVRAGGGGATDAALLENDSGREVLEIVAASQDKRFSLQQEEILRRFSDPDVAGMLQKLEAELDEADIVEEEDAHGAPKKDEETPISPAKKEESIEEEATKKAAPASPAVVGKEEQVEDGVLTALQNEAKEFDKIESARSGLQSKTKTTARVIGATAEGEAVATDRTAEEEAELEGSTHLSTADSSSESDPPEAATRRRSSRFSSDTPPGAYSVTPGQSSYRSLDVSITSYAEDGDDIESRLTTTDLERQHAHSETTAHGTTSNIDTPSVADELHMVEAQLVEDAQASRLDSGVVVASSARGGDGAGAGVEHQAPDFKLVRRYTLFGMEIPVKTIIIFVLLLALSGLTITITAILSTGKDSSDSSSETPSSLAPASYTTLAPTTAPPASTNSLSDATAIMANQTRFEDLRFLLTSSNVTPDDSLFDDPASPQYQALQWLVYDDPAQISTDTLDNYSVIQRYVMAVLFYSTGGPTSWKKSFNFLSGEHECKWKETDEETGEELGAKECNQKWGTGITMLSMYWNNMTGTLPQELGSLTTVKMLNFVINDLTGTIPNTLENLHDLEQLFLNNNKFEGTVPEGLADLQSLGLLTVYDNPDLSGNLDFLCSEREEQPLFWLVADCAGSHSRVNCPCCHNCCNMEVSLCCPMDALTSNITGNSEECWDPTPLQDATAAFGE